MADIIQLLPDAIANQIAAGEVIQRPASVVKELMENSIDAGSTNIKLIVKDAGKTLIQVIDNGCGMSETDARMSFERHATSKIREAKDLFSIRTMGFRGEALASIAAIAHVEMRTRKQVDDLGTRIVTEGTEIRTQEACQSAPGTSISVKNLFFNVPARRNFLKSNTVEMKHIVDEFQRIALAHPDVFFTLHHNNAEVLHLPKGNLRQRIKSLFGTQVNKKLVPVFEETDILKLEGFVGKPEYVKKTRGEQLFFVNNRFIKSGYLNHAVMAAYEDLIPKDTYPLFVIFIEVDSASIDINVHPTKQEIKFDDERLVYNYLKVAVRHALGQYGMMPTLDFDQDPNFSTPAPVPSPKVYPSSSSHTNTVGNNGGGQAGAGGPSPSQLERSNLKNWQKLYDGLDEFDKEGAADPLGDSGEDNGGSVTIQSKWGEESALDEPGGSFSKPQKEPYQVHASYIVSHIKSGFVLIDQQAAHERILYERYLKLINEQDASTQKQLFAKTIDLSTGDALMLKEILPQVNLLGFDIQDFGSNSFVINGVPSELAGKGNETVIIESLLEQYKLNVELKLDIQENIARSTAKSASIKKGQVLDTVEMQTLIDQLFACEVPFKSPSGRSCMITFELDELAKRFQ